MTAKTVKAFRKRIREGVVPGWMIPALEVVTTASPKSPLPAIMALGLFVSAGVISAHPDSWHNIELLTQQIGAGDARPPLFYARATEYRTVDKFAEAEADLRECLRRDPSFLPARKDLALVLLAAGRTEEARAAARDAVAGAAGKPAAAVALAWSTLAHVELARKDYGAVIEATREALKLTPRGQLDWYLMREAAFRGLGRLDDAIADLRAGHDALKSSVLRTAWLDALIDAGRGSETLATIQAVLAEARFKSQWLIRRARVRQAHNDAVGAALDLEAALGELDLRIHPDDPDPTLLVERGMVWALKDDPQKAQQELARACKILPEPDVLAPLERLLAARRQAAE